MVGIDCISYDRNKIESVNNGLFALKTNAFDAICIIIIDRSIDVILLHNHCLQTGLHGKCRSLVYFN